MFARISTFQGPPDQTAEGIRVAREQILPAARLQEGFLGIYLLYDRESGRSLSITFWESEEDMKASEELGDQTRREAAETGEASNEPRVQRFEVLLDDMV